MSSPQNVQPKDRLDLDDAFTVERWVPPFRSPNAHIPPRPRKEAPPLGVAAGPPPIVPLASGRESPSFRVERDVPLLPIPAPRRPHVNLWGLVILAALICLDLVGAALLYYRRHQSLADVNVPVILDDGASVRPGPRGTIGDTCNSGSLHCSSRSGR
jgi:hypothetical protein